MLELSRILKYPSAIHQTESSQQCSSLPLLDLSADGSLPSKTYHASTTVGIAGRARVVYSARHPDDSIGIGGSQDTFLIHVCNSPTVGDVEVRGQFFTLKVAHTIGTVAGYPLITFTFVIGCVHRLPGVSATTCTPSGIFPVTSQVIEVPRRELAHCSALICGDWLLESGSPIGVDLNVGIAKASNARQRAKVL